MADIKPSGIDQTSGQNRVIASADNLVSPSVKAPTDTDVRCLTDNPQSPGLGTISRFRGHVTKVSLTNGVATDLFSATVGTNLYFASRINYAVQARDTAGTANQCRAGQAGAVVTCGNSSGVTATAVDAGTSALAASTGTLTVTFSIVDTGGSVFVTQVTATTSLSNPGLSIIYSLMIDSTVEATIIN